MLLSQNEQFGLFLALNSRTITLFAPRKRLLRRRTSPSRRMSRGSFPDLLWAKTKMAVGSGHSTYRSRVF